LIASGDIFQRLSKGGWQPTRRRNLGEKKWTVAITW
jgi:hypothetical protein